jgi:hypothetical protein
MNITDYIVKVKAYLLDRNIYDNETLKEIVSDKIAWLVDTTNVPEDEFNTALQGAVVELVLLRINELGSEGIISQSFGGNSESINQDIPAKLLRTIRKNSRLKTV